MSHGRFLIIFTLPLVFSANADDPSYQELDLFDWTSGLRVAYCVDAPLPDLISPFRRTIAKVTTKYCHNTTACNLKTPVIFQPEQIALLDGFPRREYGSIHIKFYIILPHISHSVIRQQRPLLPRAVVSDMLSKHLNEISNRLGWSIISYEKYPRYDTMTEFMNIAIIPIVIFSIPLMIFLAYWVSTLRPNMGSEAWLVTGSAGGKNAALRRTMEIIAEQNAEFERQKRVEMTKNVVITGGNDGITSTGQLLLNVASLPAFAGFKKADNRLSMASSAHTTTSPTSPNAMVSPSESSFGTLPNVATLTVPTHPTHLNVAKKHQRRQSSVEEIKQARRARGMSTSQSSGRKPWKSGSVMLGAFARK